MEKSLIEKVKRNDIIVLEYRKLYQKQLLLSYHKNGKFFLELIDTNKK